MESEKEYIDYLIENKDKIDTAVLDSYFLGTMDFQTLIESIDTTQHIVLSYRNFLKYKKINELLK